MKRILSLFLCFMMLLSLAVNASAATANKGTIVYSKETTLEGGLTVVDEVILYDQNARSSERTADRKKTIYHGDTMIAVIKFTATFRFDGSTVSVVSKTVTQTDTYDGWSYKQSAFTSSGGTVTLSGKVTKLLIFNSSFTMGLVCDVNGNITST